MTRRCPKCGWEPYQPGAVVLIPSDAKSGERELDWQVLTGPDTGKRLERAAVIRDLEDGWVVVLKRGERVVLPMAEISPYGITG